MCGGTPDVIVRYGNIVHVGGLALGEFYMLVAREFGPHARVLFEPMSAEDRAGAVDDSGDIPLLKDIVVVHSRNDAGELGRHMQLEEAIKRYHP